MDKFLDDMEDGLNGLVALLFWIAGLAVAGLALLLFTGAI